MPLRGHQYDERFARLAEQGHDMHGEADLVVSLLGLAGTGSPRAGYPLDPQRRPRVLDAGCGTGRVAMELARRGIEVVGADAEAAMLDVAREKAPELTWHLVDLAEVPVPGGPFDLVVAAGNVMIFLELASEPAVIANLAAVLRGDGLLVAGFQLGRQLPLPRYDRLCAAAGLQLAERWATWDRRPFDGGDYAVSVHRPAVSVHRPGTMGSTTPP